MVKKLLVSFTAAATAACMVLTPCVTVFATGDTPVTGNNTVDGNVTATDGNGAVNAYGDATITVNGDVSASGQQVSTNEHPAVFDNNSTVNITGNVTAADGANAIEASDGATVTVGGNVTQSGVINYSSSGGQTSQQAGNAIEVSDGSTVTVGGNVVTQDGGTAIKADIPTSSGPSTSSTPSTVTVKGNVDASGSSYTYTSDGRQVFNGATGVDAAGNATVNISGNVVGSTRGVDADKNSTVTVGGSVTATGADATTSTWNEQTQAHDIYKNTVGGTGISSDGNATIKVGGNVNAVEMGVLINPDNDNKAGSLIIGGTINVSSKNADGIQIYKAPASRNGIDYSSVEDFMNDVPTIVVGGINANTPVHANGSINGLDENASRTALTEAVVNTINYIITVEDQTKNNYGVKVSGDNVHQIAGYDTVNINKAFSVTAALPSDYYLSGGDFVNVVDNGNGTYTLTLTNAKGGIYVKAILKKVDDKVIVVSTDDGTYINNPPSNEPPAGAITVSTAAAGTTSAISGDKPAVSLSFDLGKVTPVQYRAAVIENIEKAPKGGAFNIETDRVSFFDRNMIEAFAKHNDIDINVVFTYNGKKIKVTIPAGYDVTKLLDDNGYCGYLRLLSLLGGTDLAQ